MGKSDRPSDKKPRCASREVCGYAIVRAGPGDELSRLMSDTVLKLNREVAQVPVNRVDTVPLPTGTRNLMAVAENWCMGANWRLQWIIDYHPGLDSVVLIDNSNYLDNDIP